MHLLCSPCIDNNGNRNNNRNASTPPMSDIMEIDIPPLPQDENREVSVNTVQQEQIQMQQRNSSILFSYQQQQQQQQRKQKKENIEFQNDNFQFLTLPDDILLHLLLFLPTAYIIGSVERVCRRMRGICSRPLIWERLIDRDLRVPPWVLTRDDGDIRNDHSFQNKNNYNNYNTNNINNININNNNNNNNGNIIRSRQQRKRALTNAIGGCWVRRQYIKAMLKERPFRVLPTLSNAPNPVSVDVALVGDCSGKTTLIHTFMHEQFPEENFSSTIVCEPFSVERELENGLRVMFRIWDTPSEEGYRFYRRHMYDNADIAVFLFCFCPDTAPSLFNLREWKQEVCNRVSNPDIVVCSIAREVDQCPFDPHVINGALDHSIQPLHLAHCVPSRMIGIHTVFEQCARAVLYPQSFALRQRSTPRRSNRRIPLPRI